MEELTGTTTKNEVSTLNALAVQAQMFVQNARMNLLQLGRVLAEAKPLVAHGEWENWVKTNTNMSKRAAEQYMQAYKKFGLSPEIAQLGTTKTLKLLPLSEDERKELFSENDVASMSTRQLDEAIAKQKGKLLKEVRAEVQKELDQEKAARIAAEKKAEQAAKAPSEETEILRAKLNRSEEHVELMKKHMEKKETEHKEKEKFLRHENDDAIQHYRKLCEDGEREKARLQQDIKERDELIEEQQEDYNRIQAELLDMKSTAAKGDVERMPTDQFTVDAFASAVRNFIGACARMPHMSATFSGMDQNEKMEYDELLRTIEAWATESRKALDSVVVNTEVF